MASTLQSSAFPNAHSDQFQTPVPVSTPSVTAKVNSTTVMPTAQTQPMQSIKPIAPKTQNSISAPQNPNAMQMQTSVPIPKDATATQTAQPSLVQDFMSNLNPFNIPKAEAQQIVQPSIFTPQKVAQMRTKMADSVVLENLYNDPNNTEFRAQVDKAMPYFSQQSKDWQENMFPTAMLNDFYKTNAPTVKDPAAAVLLNGMTQSQETPWWKPTIQNGVLPTFSADQASGQGLKGVGEGLYNMGASAVNFGLNTAKGLVQIPVGAVEQGLSAATGTDINDPFNSKGVVQGLESSAMHPIQTAGAIKDHYINTYGTPEKALHAIFENPAGFLSDLLTPAMVAGGVLKGAGAIGSAATAGASDASLAGKIGSISDAASNIGDSLTTFPTVQKGVDAAKEAAKPITDAMQGIADKAAQKVMAATLKLQPNDRRRIALPNIAGTTPEKWLLDRGISGSPTEIQDKLEQLGTASKAQLDAGLAGITKTYDIGLPADNPEQLMNIMRSESNAKSGEILNRMINTPTDTTPHPIQQALAVLKNTFQGKPGNEDIVSKINELQGKQYLTLSDMNQVKRMLDSELNIYKSTGEISSGATARGLSNIRDAIKTTIENEATANGFKQVKDLNKTTQVAHEIGGAIAKRAQTAANNSKISLKSLGAAGVGSMVAGLPGAIAGYGIDEILSNPTLRTTLASHFASLGTDAQSALARELMGITKPANQSILKSIIKNAALPVGTITNDQNSQ